MLNARSPYGPFEERSVTAAWDQMMQTRLEGHLERLRSRATRKYCLFVGRSACRILSSSEAQWLKDRERQWKDILAAHGFTTQIHSLYGRPVLLRVTILNPKQA